MTKIKKIILMLTIYFCTSSITIAMNQSGNQEIFRITPATVLAPGKIRFQNTYTYINVQDLKVVLFTNDLEYGISKPLSLQLTTPIVLNYQEKPQRTQQGIGKLRLRGNIRWFLQDNFASILRVGIEMPMTNIKNSTIIGFNSTDFTFEYRNIFLSDDWFLDSTFTTFITTKAHDKKRGSFFTHEFDFAKQFSIETKSSPINVLLGINMFGIYRSPNRFNDIKDPNSGLYILALGPLISISKENFLVDFMPKFPISQHLRGIQGKLNYVLATSFQIIF